MPKFVVLCVYHPAGWHPAKTRPGEHRDGVGPAERAARDLQVPIFGSDENQEVLARCSWG